jgi:phosphoglycolate phosphatase-like HAD superfamily hydrolase
MNWIIFDFDGTIADSFDVFVEAANRLALAFGYPPISLEQIPEIKNLSSQQVLQRAAIPAWKMPFFLHRFRQELRSLQSELRPIDGICSTLTSLHHQGYQLGIVSSNARQTVEDFLLLYELRHLFQFIYGGQALLGKSRTFQSNYLCRRRNARY